MSKYVGLSSRTDLEEAIAYGLRKISRAIADIADEIFYESDSTRPILVLGRDCEILYYMLVSRGLNVKYAEISRALITDPLEVDLVVESIQKWACGQPVMVIDTGYMGTIFETLRDHGLEIEGRLLYSGNPMYGTFDTYFERTWVRVVELLPKFTRRSTMLDENLNTIEFESTNDDIGNVNPRMAILAIRLMLRYAGEGTKVAIRALKERRQKLLS